MRPSIPGRPADTSSEAERVQIDLLRAAPVCQRLQLALSLSATVIGAARQGLARAHPKASKRELDLLFVELHHGRELSDALRRDLARRDGLPPS